MFSESFCGMIWQSHTPRYLNIITKTGLKRGNYIARTKRGKWYTNTVSVFSKYGIVNTSLSAACFALAYFPWHALCIYLFNEAKCFLTFSVSRPLGQSFRKPLCLKERKLHNILIGNMHTISTHICFPFYPNNKLLYFSTIHIY